MVRRRYETKWQALAIGAAAFLAVANATQAQPSRQGNRPAAPRMAAVPARAHGPAMQGVPRMGAPNMHFGSQPNAHANWGGSNPHFASNGAHFGGVREHHEFAHHDVAHFNREEMDHWRGGEWRHHCFEGRCGWWWYAAGQWYFYERPIYPFPLFVSEIAYAEPVVVAPAPVVVEPAPVVVAPPVVLAAPPVVVVPAPVLVFPR